MNKQSEFQHVFEHLKKIISDHADGMNCVKDEPSDYCLETRYIMKNKKPLFYGAVQIRKTYVSYHLMPVYVFPELLTDISSELKRRMQGKSCFNFKSIDKPLFEELGQLTELGYQRYQKAGYIQT